MLSGETLCKFAQIFPPKDLVYFWKIFLDTFLSKVIVNKRQLKLIALLCCNNSKSKKENKRQVEKYFLFSFVLLFLIVVVEVNKLSFFKKKKIRRMRRGRAVFSKSFGATFQSYFHEDKKLT